MASKKTDSKLNMAQSDLAWDKMTIKGTKNSNITTQKTKKKKSNKIIETKSEGNNIYVKINLKSIDSSNITKFDSKLRNFLAGKKKFNITFDMDDVDYASSTILRRMVMIKNGGNNVKIVNANRKLYDIFAVVGLDKMIEIGTKKLNISTKKLKQFATGGNGKIYNFTRDEILKIYFDFQSEEKIIHGMENAKMAFNKGLPVVIPYASVQTDQGVGVIYERVGGKSLADAMHNNKKFFDKGAIAMTQLCKRLATTHFEETDKMTYVKDGYVNGLDPIKKFLPKRLVDAYNIAIEVMPNTNTAVHGDFQGRNILLDGSELLLIDLDDFGLGHPIWDVASAYTAYGFLNEKGDEDETYAMVGLNVAEAGRAWKIFTDEYFKDIGKREAQRRINAAKWYGSLRGAKLYSNRFVLTTLKDPTTKFVVEMVRNLLEYSVGEHLYDMVSIFKT